MSTSSLGTVLVTGVGGPAGYTVLRALAGHADLFAGDVDPVAVGLYFVDPSRRVLLPRGEAEDFVDVLLHTAIGVGADLVVPTVDSELRAVSAARDHFREHGIELLVESVDTLDICLDKYALMRRCAGTVRVPTTVLLDHSTGPEELATLGEPFIVKPRQGAGGRGFEILASRAELVRVPHDGTMIAQEMLPGAEFSIDVLCRPGGGVVVAVPRRRDKVDSGIAVAGRTVTDPALERFGRSVAELIGAQGVVNVQAKLGRDGQPGLLEVNARFPGTMALTQAAGVDMPLLAAQGALGTPLPERLDFREIAVVRYWADIVVPVEEYAQLTPSDPALSVP